MRHEYGACAWDMCNVHVYGACVWDMRMGHMYGACAWGICMGHRYGTCVYTGHVHGVIEYAYVYGMCPGTRMGIVGHTLGMS